MICYINTLDIHMRDSIISYNIGEDALEVALAQAAFQRGESKDRDEREPLEIQRQFLQVGQTQEGCEGLS